MHRFVFILTAAELEPLIDCYSKLHSQREVILFTLYQGTVEIIVAMKVVVKNPIKDGK